MRKQYFFFILGLAFILFFICCFDNKNGDKNNGANADKNKKILIVHSYDPEVIGVLNKNRALQFILDQTDIEYKTIYMDTKRNTSEAFKRNAGIKAMDFIEQYSPDVVITFDDNAFKYLVMPYYKDAALPIVFAGIDWDVSIYGAPYRNTTGIVSVEPAVQMIAYLKEYAEGTRIAWLGYDTFTARKQVKAYRDILKINMSVYYVKDFSEWKKTFLYLQSNTDMIIQSGILASMKDWNEKEAEKYAAENIRIPVGAVNELVMGCSVFGMVKSLSEIGDWAAKTAIEIVRGKNVSAIPVTQTKEGKILINLDLAEKLDIAFDPKILRSAKIFNSN